MPLCTLPDPTLGTGAATLLTRVDKWSMVHLYVQGPNTVMIASKRTDLDAGVGLPFIASDGIRSLWWQGEIWAQGSGPGSSIVYEVMQRHP